MTQLIGTWDVSMRTPIGTMRAVMTFRDDNGTYQGEAESKTETTPLLDLDVQSGATEDHVTWSQTITTPMRLQLAFDVTVRGTQMTGHSRAGRLPRTTVTGVRRAD